MQKQTTILDCEVYKDYFLAQFLETSSGKIIAFEQFDGQPLDLDRLRRFLRQYRLVTFNGANFDLPVLAVALTGADCARIKQACDAIINRGYRAWQFEQAWGIKIPRVDHIDLIEVAPGIASLKIYGGRLGCPKMQDLPIPPESSIPPEMHGILREYCANDLATTLALYNKLKPQIDLRETMGKEYDIDLRSKSDAQIAEAVITHEVERIAGWKIERPQVPAGTAYKYRAPAFINFTSQVLRDKLAEILAADFVVLDNGSVAEPDALKGKTVKIGAGVYRLGIGGLHSSETCQAVEADDDHVLVDRDVASYYPAIILRTGLAPKQMGTAFIKVYQGIVERRLAAKKAGQKVAADALKITINGSFGKFGSHYSRLYSPDLLIQTTVTGQLALLMLIESLEAAGIQVVSANTDGIVIRCHRKDLQILEHLVKSWEQATGFDTEETGYRALYSRDVNNYIAIKPDNSVKLKGAYAPAGLMKNPTNPIVADAVISYLTDGVPLADTIRACSDIAKFATIRTVKGGAVDQAGDYLGKAVRWYYSTEVTGPLRYKVNGYTVARSDGARPMMDLPAQFPSDVNFGWYEREALSVLSDIGAVGGLI
jgi:hypothetical protein